jgi:cytochrome c oxidase cbb3-type subunit 2
MVNLHKRSAAIVMAITIVLAGWQAAARSGETPTVERLKTGKFVYERGCATCHGMQGKGDGLAAPYLDPRPRDFTKGEFKFRTTPNGAIPTVEDLARTITHGLNGTAMSPWTELSKQDLQAVIAYVETFSARFKTETANPIKVPRETPFNMEAVRRGERWYTDIECGKCHGTEGRGDGPSAAELKDNSGFSIRPADLTQAARYKRGASPTDIYLTVFTGLTGTPMPSNAGNLEKPEDEWDLVYYVYWLSQGKSFANAQKALRSQSFSITGVQQTWVK